jgi:hypothetical protein
MAAAGTSSGFTVFEDAVFGDEFELVAARADKDEKTGSDKQASKNGRRKNVIEFLGVCGCERVLGSSYGGKYAQSPCA